MRFYSDITKKFYDDVGSLRRAEGFYHNNFQKEDSVKFFAMEREEAERKAKAEAAKKEKIEKKRKFEQELDSLHKEYLAKFREYLALETELRGNSDEGRIASEILRLVDIFG